MAAQPRGPCHRRAGLRGASTSVPTVTMATPSATRLPSCSCRGTRRDHRRPRLPRMTPPTQEGGRPTRRSLAATKKTATPCAPHLEDLQAILPWTLARRGAAGRVLAWRSPTLHGSTVPRAATSKPSNARRPPADISACTGSSARRLLPHHSQRWRPGLPAATRKTATASAIHVGGSQAMLPWTSARLSATQRLLAWRSPTFQGAMVPLAATSKLMNATECPVYGPGCIGRRALARQTFAHVHMGQPPREQLAPRMTPQLVQIAMRAII